MTRIRPRAKIYPEVPVTRTLTCLLVAAAAVAANPYVETFLSEVCVDPAHQFVELHCAPQSDPIDLYGWQIVTSTSACTLTCELGYDEFLVVDSAALAEGDVGYGAIHLNPLGDSVMLVTDSGPVADIVYYPRYPTGHDSAPLPPSTGSVAFWNYDDAEGQSMNWYVDSTPTPDAANDDYSVIAGSLTGTGGITMDYAYVVVAGQNGILSCGLYDTSYVIAGFGAGTYQVSAGGYYNGQFYSTVYPDSVTIGYSETLALDIVIPLTGMAETPSKPLLPPMRVSGRILLLSGDGTTPVNVQLYNLVGSRVNAFHLGPIIGEKRIELPATLAPGVYFAEAQRGTYRTTVKVVLW